MIKKDGNIKPMRAAELVEHKFVTAILNGTYPPGVNLPSERALAEELEVTRPTLRETMKRLANEGWITIQHGKPTLVNDFWSEGGLGLLKTLIKYSEFLPPKLIFQLLQVRNTVMPDIAQMAVAEGKEQLLDFLSRAESLPNDAQIYQDYDWDLQFLMVSLSKNPVFQMIFNDFNAVYRSGAVYYYSMPEAREHSRLYYKDLIRTIKQDPAGVTSLVRTCMEGVMSIWMKAVIPESSEEDDT